MRAFRPSKASWRCIAAIISRRSTPTAGSSPNAGMAQAKVPAAAYAPIWCAWGYERDIHRRAGLRHAAKASELGLGWAVLDDGWQKAVGDWGLDPTNFRAAMPT